MSDCEPPTIIHMFRYFPASKQQKHDNDEMARLNYMTSRLQAALCKWAISAPPPEAMQWWWTGLQNKLDVAMANVGYTASYFNIFLDIPNFLQGLSQSIHPNGSLEFTLSKAMWQEIECVPDPQDLTEAVEEYYHNWWNREDQWQNYPQVRVDGEEAFSWHILKYGHIWANKNASPDPGSAPPETTSPSTCKSWACKERLLSIFGEVKKANQTVRSLMITMEEQRIAATRYILHLKALRKYQLHSWLDTLTLTDLKNLLYEVFEGCDTNMEHNPIAGPSTNSGPSTNQSFTPQSLSFNGYSDSDADYVPSIIM
ncbi:hypothetical protein BYT27DRAFT_7262222 [Phlegmacium glaucopus]|nr:hypothetical protein BYT27DRAFT_7262222 [Phlegmacium glaucopus]